MQFFFKSTTPQAKLLRNLVERRLRFSLRRVAWLVPQATVKLSDANGPRTDLDKHCEVELHTAGSGKVVVTSVSSSWNTALDDGLARAARHVLKLLRREHETWRSRPRRDASLMRRPVMLQKAPS